MRHDFDAVRRSIFLDNAVRQSAKWSNNGATDSALKGADMTLVPAYGKDYKSKAEVTEAWDSGKDFQIASVGPYMGAYVTKRELVGKEKEVTIRYRKLAQVVVLKL
jgi:hypothetical protein